VDVERVCRLLSAYALTPIHVGAGRSPGIVDLPVVRDMFGLPYLPGSSLKGVLKSLCLRGRDYSVCRAAFGWDLRIEREPPSDASVSALVFGDAFLAFYPVRFDDGERMVYGYATSLAQLAQLLDMVMGCSSAMGRRRGGETLASDCLGGSAGGGAGGFFNNVPVAPRSYVYCGSSEKGRACMLARRLLDALVAGSGGGLAGLLSENLYVFPEQGLYAEIVEAGMVRQARVRLDPVKKTVERGALWTEEYVPQATVFAGLVAARPVPGMEADEAISLLEELLAGTNGTVFLGGKETIGKGFAKLSLHEPTSLYGER